MKDCSVGLVDSVFLCLNCFHRLGSADQLSGMSSIPHSDSKMLTLAAAAVSFFATLSEWSGIPSLWELCQNQEVLPEPSLEDELRLSTNRLDSSSILYSCS